MVDVVYEIPPVTVIQQQNMMGVLVLFLPLKGDSKAVSNLRFKYFVGTETLEHG